MVARWPGSVHDSRIFDNSRARVLYEENRVPGLLLGDAGYACQPFLMTPLADPGPSNTPHGRYNKAHIKTRNSVERAFGVWKRRFPCLDMKLQHKPVRAARIVIACAALHNLGRARKEPEPPASRVPTLVANCRTGLHLPPATARDSRLGSLERDALIQRSFS